MPRTNANAECQRPERMHCSHRHDIESVGSIVLKRGFNSEGAAVFRCGGIAGHGRACWRLDPIANDPKADSKQETLGLAGVSCLNGPKPDDLDFIVLLERIQEIHEISFLLLRESDAESLVVEIHRIEQGRGRTVVEIRRARSEPA